ncbi:MAG: c-type cytochrome [Planctomycetia bacterium]|nr:c-type cytochrome [Planctomycetia bacterium]
MPATEQTWRDVKWMHVLFGVSGVAMLVTTVWMLAADHYREWKPVQRKFRDIEAWFTQARISDQDSAQYEQRGVELAQALAEAQAEPPPEALVAEFIAQAKPRAADNGYDLAAIEKYDREIRGLEQTGDSSAQPAADSQAQFDQAAYQVDVVEARRSLVDAMRKVVRKAQFDEDKEFTLLKGRRAELDVERSRYNLGVGEGLPEQELEERQMDVDKAKADVDQMTAKYEQAKTHRIELERIVAEATARETAAAKDLEDHNSKIKQLEKAKKDRQLTVAKEFLDLPIFDGFNSPLKIEQIWLPKLTLNNNFRDVARFDRCTTCHQAIDKTGSGGGAVPAYPPRPHEMITLTLATPAEPPPELLAAPPRNEEERSKWLQTLYGLELADKGLIDPRDVTVRVVRSLSPGAEARLEIGDIFRYINDVAVDKSRDLVYRYLLETVSWGKPITLRVDRGLPNPYSSHPRLDLYLGSRSPHKMMELGCTICHEGQGSGTSFQWASHTPNAPQEAKRWKDEHGWFNNHHWIFPMRPERFIESGCLKCHQDVAELEPSERFPDPPAPKLMAGYNVIRQYGCFGCHEINGYDGPTRRRGPDMRAEPNYTAAAAQVLIDPGLDDRERELAHDVIEHPDRTELRKRLAELIDEDAARAAKPAGAPSTASEGAEAGGDGGASAEPAKLTAGTHAMATILGADDETPGKYRKVGPSLRYVKSKLSGDFLYSWIRDPVGFRPTTRMPKFFGLDDHLREIRRDQYGRPQMEPKRDEQGAEVVDEEGHPVLVPVYVESPGLELSRKFEPVEIRAVSEYLLHFSQPFEYAQKPKGVTDQPSAERGKQVFERRGCLACHQHAAFPDFKATQGPDLSRIGDKLTTPEGAQWLYSWVREPNRYHARTVMPNLFLEPVEGADGKVSDPAADVAAFLLGSHQDWKPQQAPDVVADNLDTLAAEYLSASFTKSQTKEYLQNGIPEKLRNQVKVDEQLLVATEGMTPEENSRHKLLYVGRRTIGRLGCAGCHDIPGFEDAKSIGTGLADWGRKEPSKLAFEQVVQYIAQQNFIHGHGQVHNIGQALDPHHMDPDTGFFTEAVLSHEREGFIWQKLREPRSYDYRMTENKQYIERLRMPKFNIDEQQIESVITFVLGLVAEPPAAQYVYKADPRRQAILDGERLVDKFNCGGCHTFAQETWEFDYDPRSFPDPPAFDGYPFELPHFTPQQLADSTKVDRRGLGHATVTGMVNPEVAEDDEGKPLYFFGLWKSVPINGHPWIVGGQEIEIPQARITKKVPPVGGDFARLLQPVALAMEQATNPNAKSSDAWGWVPPPLVGEGRKVQTQWLHDFLLNPYRIRPAVVLRMPRFNMSSQEAAQLANYFAAVDGAQYPYQLDHRTESSYLAAQETAHPHRFQNALTLVTSNKFCVQCHLLGDYTPPGSVAALAPNLDRVYQRLRGDWLQIWLAKPKRELPYTGMPENLLPGKPAPQDLYPGTALEQLEGVEDFLLNYDAYMKDRTSIKPMVKPAPPETAAGGGSE